MNQKCQVQKSEVKGFEILLCISHGNVENFKANSTYLKYVFTAARRS